jgi:hypothetical protein
MISGSAERPLPGCDSASETTDQGQFTSMHGGRLNVRF